MAGTEDGVSRRAAMASLGLGALGIGGVALAQDASRPPVDLGTVRDGKVLFPPPQANSETQPASPPNADAPADKVGFAIVGLGKLALEQVLPAFAQAKHVRPVALVSGSPVKMAAVAKQYGIAPDSCYPYSDMARLRDNPAVQVVYVITPNALHRAACHRGGRSGKACALRKADGALVVRLPRDGRGVSLGQCEADDRVPNAISAARARGDSPGAKRRARVGDVDGHDQQSESGRPSTMAADQGACGWWFAARCRALLP